MVFVGDRGMVKAKGKGAPTMAGFRYITALDHPQVRLLLQTQALRTEWVTAQVYEVLDGAPGSSCAGVPPSANKRLGAVPTSGPSLSA